MEYVFEIETKDALPKLPSDKRLKKLNAAVLALAPVSAAAAFLFGAAYAVYGALTGDTAWAIACGICGALSFTLLLANVILLAVLNKRKPEFKTGTVMRATFTGDCITIESFNGGVKYSVDKIGYGLIKQVRENDEYYYLMLSDTALYPIRKNEGDGFKEFLNERIANAPSFSLEPAPETDENEVIFKNSTKLDKKSLQALNGYCYRGNKKISSRYVKTFIFAVALALIFLLIGGCRLVAESSLFGIIGLGLYFALMIYAFTVGRLSKKRSRQAAFGVPVTVYLTVTTEGLKTRGFLDDIEIGRDEISYKDMKKVVDCGDYYFVFINDEDAYIFDKNNFIVGNPNIFTEFFDMKKIPVEKYNTDIKKGV